MFRKRRPPRQAAEAVELTGLDPPWRAAVEELVASRTRLREVAAQLPPGPTQDRVAGITERVETSVRAAWEVAGRAQAASRTVASLDVDAVHEQLKSARRRLAGVEGSRTEADAQAIEHEVELLAEQHAALHQLANAVDDARERLRILDLRVDAAVARAAQLALLPDAAGVLSSVDQELQLVVEELGALRDAFTVVGDLGQP